MKKSTHILDEMDVRKIVHEELEYAKPTWVAEISKNVEEKFDKVMTALDTFVGEIKNYRETQELIAQKLSDHEDQLENLHTRVKKIERPVL